MNKIRLEHHLNDRSIPYYYQIMKILRRRIEQGELTPGEKLPTEMDLAKSFGVSRVTLRQALSILEADGLLDRERGHGTFISKTLPKHQINGNYRARRPRRWRTPSSLYRRSDSLPRHRSVFQPLEEKPHHTNTASPNGRRLSIFLHDKFPSYVPC